MKETTNYALTKDDLHRIIDSWGQAREYSERVLNIVTGFNLELLNNINNNVPLSSNSIARQYGFQRANRQMHLYIKFLPEYLKSVKSGKIISPLSSEELDELTII